jgi:quercetin dioxygenase-like cupin family protein
MISRRDLCVALVAASTACAAVVWAQSPGKPVMNSTTFDWNLVKAAPTPTGQKRVFMRAPTLTLDQLAIHATTINPGERAHDPHRHWEEELIIVKEGTVESMQNGETTVVGPGSVIFEASNELHGLRNVGDTPATYLVIKWFPPGTLNADKQ